MKNQKGKTMYNYVLEYNRIIISTFFLYIISTSFLKYLPRKTGFNMNIKGYLHTKYIYFSSQNPVM